MCVCVHVVYVCSRCSCVLVFMLPACDHVSSLRVPVFMLCVCVCSCCMCLCCMNRVKSLHSLTLF